MSSKKTFIIEIPDGYYRRIDGSTAFAQFFGAFGDRLTCRYCGRKVVHLYGYEHKSLPDIEMCGACVELYESS